MNSNDTEKLNNLLAIIDGLPKLKAFELSFMANFVKITVEQRKATIHTLQLVKAK